MKNLVRVYIRISDLALWISSLIAGLWPVIYMPVGINPLAFLPLIRGDSKPTHLARHGFGFGNTELS
jgi:hypothetical protein